MRSTDLAVVFGIALVVGAGAGFAASAMSTPEAVDDGAATLEQQVDELGSELREVRGEWKKSERARDRLADRLARAESRLAQIEGLTNRSDGSVDATAAGRPSAEDVIAGPREAAVARNYDRLLKDLARKPGTEAVRAQLTQELEERTKRIHLAAQLRAMPEEERWAKAQADLNLSASQVADLKDAMAVRETRIEEGKSVTEMDLPNGGRFKRVKLDQEVVKAAQTEYDERLDRVLGRDQKAAWKDKGYENAFGRPRGNVVSLTSGAKGGGTSTIQITTSESSEEK